MLLPNLLRLFNITQQLLKPDFFFSGKVSGAYIKGRTAKNNKKLATEKTAEAGIGVMYVDKNTGTRFVANNGMLPIA